MEDIKHDSVWYKKKIDEITKELHYTVGYALKPLSYLVLIKDRDGRAIVRVSRFSQLSAMREAYEQIARYKKYLDSAKQERYGLYKYTGPTMFIGEHNEYQLKSGMRVKAEVNINIAHIKKFVFPNGGTQAVDVDVAAKYLKPVKPETIDFTKDKEEEPDKKVIDEIMDRVDKIHEDTLAATPYLMFKDIINGIHPASEENNKDDFADVLYEILRKTSTKFGYPFPDESCADDCKKSLKDWIDKFDKPSDETLGILHRMAHEQNDDHHEVGGTHYKMAIEPWDFIYANHIPFDEGSAIKYLCRHKDKNGAEDVKKAISFCEHILKTQYGEELDKG